MPQCIAQQDPSIWLKTMTECTAKRCTKHFLWFCSHHQWLTQLSCLSNGFNPEVIEPYLQYCSRSVLAKAQLYLWVHSISGRTWLGDVGDANSLQHLSPASLDKGYVGVEIINKAPACLAGSVSASSTEPLQDIIASCSFTSRTHHNGNAARPWEYSEAQHSMVALDFETTGYNLTGHRISDGEYFDKDCFCRTFTIDPKMEPCLRLEGLELTRERLWMNATCGSSSLPENWRDALKITGSAYIPTYEWHWPTGVTEIPNRFNSLTEKCATNACKLDERGYCIDTHVVDMACFCHDISYNSCQHACQTFESRIEYVKWLHNLCSKVRDWQGRSVNWRKLAVPFYLETIPWQWTVKPSNDSTFSSLAGFESVQTKTACASTEWKIGSIVLVNMATLFGAYFGRSKGIDQLARKFLWSPHPQR